MGAALICAACGMAASPRADAQVPAAPASPSPSSVASSPAPVSPQNAAISSALCSLPWETARPQGDSVLERFLIFAADGTFTCTQGKETQVGKWTVDGGKKITLAFADQHSEALSLPLDPLGTECTDATGDVMDAVQVPADPPAPAPEVQSKAADLVSTYQGSLIIVEGKEGSGSGFIANFGKSKFLFTNIHVVTGVGASTFKALDGTALTATSLSAAGDRDVFCVGVNQTAATLDLMQDVEKEAHPGDDVVVLGNADGAGVVNTILGKLVAVNADTIEVNAPFIPGNSGSPIIHLKTGKVIGIATFHKIVNFGAVEDSKGKVKPIIRRYGYRLDNIKGWQAVEWRSFSAQAAEMEDVEGVTDGLKELLLGFEHSGTSLDSNGIDNPVVAKCIDQWRDHRINGSAAMANRDFLASVKVLCQTDINTARLHIGYAFFQHKLADQIKERGELLEELEKDLTKLGM